MRPLPALPALAACLALAAAPAAAAPAAPPERFVARDASMVFVLPSLQRTLEQASGLFATAASFPGGDRLEAKRAELAREVGFDLLDRSWFDEAGLDARRGAAISLASGGDLDDDDDDEVVLVLPVANAARFEETVARVARADGYSGARAVLPGAPRVIVHRGAKPGGDALAYALAEGNAVLALHPEAGRLVKAALAVPRGAHLGTTPAYRDLLRALGPGPGVVFYLPPGSRAAKDEPVLAGGAAAAVAGAADGVRVEFAFVPPPTAPLPASPGEEAALLGKLHPGAFLVARNAADLRASVEVGRLLPGDRELSPRARRRLADLAAALGAGLALGVSAVEQPAGGEAPSLARAPFAWFRGELAAGVRDPAAMRAVIRSALQDSGEKRVSERGPWVFSVLGGELGLVVENRTLLVAFGPDGALDALSARRGTRLVPPTPASARALAGGPTGLYLDVPRLVAHLGAIPASAFGTTPKARRDHDALQAALPVLRRLRELALTTERSGPILRTALTVRVEPAGAETRAKAEAEETWGRE